MVTLTRGGERPVLVVAAAREDRRVLFDALDGMEAGEILSARSLGQARALLDKSPRPALAVLDFEHAPGASRIRDVLGLGSVAATAPVVREVVQSIASTPPPSDDAETVLRNLAGLFQSGRDAAGVPGLVQRAMHVLGMDMMVVAERGAATGALETLGRVDSLSMSGERDLLAEAFVQRALGGIAIVRCAWRCAGRDGVRLAAHGHIGHDALAAHAGNRRGALRGTAGTARRARTRP